LVLAVHSEYFQKALKSGFKDGKSKEFEFQGGSGHAYWRVFEYMYTGQYSEESVDILDTEGMNFSHPDWISFS